MERERSWALPSARAEGSQFADLGQLRETPLDPGPVRGLTAAGREGMPKMLIAGLFPAVGGCISGRCAASASVGPADSASRAGLGEAA